MNDAPLFYIITGEPSGDQLGARLMAALSARLGGRVRFAGIGGEMMAAQGLVSPFPIRELAVMGLAEVLPRIPNILRRLRETVDDIRARRPVAVITIDSWGFTGRVHQRLKLAEPSIARLHYVAPMVWAWKEGRARKMAARIDMLMCLLPNEPPYFRRHGLDAVHVGHPVIESGAENGDGDGFRRRHGIPPEAGPLVCVLPGSRHSEVSRLLPVFGATLGLLAERRPGLRAVVPTVETVADEVAAAAAAWPVPALVVRGAAEKYDAFAACDAALAASGTVALELALARLPSVVGYRMNAVTSWLARRLVKLKWVSLPNLLVERTVMPELLLDECRPPLLAEALERLLDDPAARQAQREGMTEALERLGYGGESPSLRAADAVLAHIGMAR